MKVYVVLTNAMGGVQYGGAFASSLEAHQHLTQGVFGSNPRVIEFDVGGVQAEQNVVYVAQTYNPTMDVHDFEGVYGSFESAKCAGGLKGLPLKVTL
jgi:hypothetical protein